MAKKLILVLTILILLSMCRTQCPNGTFKGVNDSCEKCKTGCASCSSLNNCTSCSPNFILSSNTCLSLSCLNFRCNKCSEDGKCIQCIPAFYPSADGTQCITDDNNCSNYSLIGGRWACTACSNGYVFRSGKCFCDTIKLLRGGQCVDCGSVFPNCVGCVESKCYLCKDGYVYDSFSKECIQIDYCKTQLPNCARCEGKYCVTCNANYLLDIASNKCIKATQQEPVCVSANSAGCSTCFNNGSTYYFNTNNNCILVNTGNCVKPSGFKCDSSGCRSGIMNKLSNSQADLCFNCRNFGCQTCSNPTTLICLTCKPGYSGENCSIYKP